MFSRKDSYDDLIDLFVEIGELKTKRIIKAFRKVRRKDFLPDYQINNAGADKALSIGHEQTNSQPRVVVRMLEWLQPQPGDRVLDLGSGSAWTTALLSNIVGRKGTVFGVERIDELVKFGRDNLGKRRNAKIIKANKRLGLPDEAPFDKILVSASCKKLPRELLGQL